MVVPPGTMPAQITLMKASGFSFVEISHQAGIAAGDFIFADAWIDKEQAVVDERIAFGVGLNFILLREAIGWLKFC